MNVGRKNPQKHIITDFWKIHWNLQGVLTYRNLKASVSCLCVRETFLIQRKLYFDSMKEDQYNQLLPVSK